MRGRCLVVVVVVVVMAVWQRCSMGPIGLCQRPDRVV